MGPAEFFQISKLKRKARHQKMHLWEYYHAFVKNTDLSKIAPLSIGKTEELAETSYEKLFGWIESYDKLLKKYNLHQVAVGGTDFDRALSVMNWLCENTWYSGMQIHFLSDDTMSILRFSFGKPFRCAINCRHKAIVLTDLLLAVGIKAYPVALIDENKDGNHLVTHVYLREQKKWCAFDPSFRSYFTDDAGTPLNIFEMRDLFLSGKVPQLNGYSFNGTQECKEVYLRVFIESCLTNISTWQDNSEDRRHTKHTSKRKEFRTKLPDIHMDVPVCGVTGQWGK